MKPIFTLVCVLFLAANVNAQSTVWVQHGKAPKTERGNAIAHDNNGNIYITGEFQDSVRFNTTLLTASYGTYCAKYDTTGTLIWAYGNMGGDGITFDGNSNLYLFDNDSWDLKKIDLNGTVIWNTTLFNTSFFGSNGIQDVVVKGTNVYVTGYYSGDAYFGNDTIYNATPSSGWDIFLACFNSSGQNTWAKTAGGNGLDKGYGIYVNNLNEIYTVGYFKDSAYFETTHLFSNGAQDMFLAKYNSAGGLLWVTNFGGTGFDLAAKIIADDNGFLYATGRFNNSIDFGATTLYASGTDAFITKFDVNGNPVWTKGISGTGNDEEADIDYENGQLAFIATTAGNVTLDTFQLVALGNLDMCIGKMDTTGTISWVKLFGGSSNDEGSGETLLNGRTYFTGSFQSTASFDSFQLISQGQWDIVTGKIDDDALMTGLLPHNRAEEFISVYPVPAHENLTISFPELMDEVFHFRIFNTLGEQVSARQNNSAPATIDISSLPAGVYYLEVNTAGFSYTKKLIIQ
jgi:hypothetical protein